MTTNRSAVQPLVPVTALSRGGRDNLGKYQAGGRGIRTDMGTISLPMEPQTKGSIRVVDVGTRRKMKGKWEMIKYWGGVRSSGFSIHSKGVLDLFAESPNKGSL